MKKLLRVVYHTLFIAGTCLVLASSSFARYRDYDDIDQLVLSRNEALELLGALEGVLQRAPRPDAPNDFDPAIPPTPFDSADLDAIARCVCLIKERLKIICSKIEILQSTVDSCCEELNSKIDVVESTLDSCCAELNSKIDNITNIDISILNSLSSCCAQLNSKIDNLSVSACDLLPVVSRIDSCCTQLNSKIDNITNIDNSILNSLSSCCTQLNSKIDTLSVSACDLGPLTSIVESCCAKIGELSDPGSCLPSLISVPDAINNLNLDVIALLKTILLDLRGCGCNCP